MTWLGLVTLIDWAVLFAGLRDHGGRKPLASGDRISASVNERAEAFATSFSYAGRYSLVGDKIIHHVEIVTVQNWVGTDLVRLVRVEDNKITLTTPPISVGGQIRTTELVWQRFKWRHVVLCGLHFRFWHETDLPSLSDNVR